MSNISPVWIIFFGVLTFRDIISIPHIWRAWYLSCRLFFFRCKPSVLSYPEIRPDTGVYSSVVWRQSLPPQLPIPMANYLSPPTACELYSMNLVRRFTSKTGPAAWRKTTAAAALESAAVRILLLFNVVYMVVHVVVIAVVQVVIVSIDITCSFIVLCSCIGIWLYF